MITKQHSHYLKFLAQGYKTLLISSENYTAYDEISKYFDLSIQRNLNADELGNVSLTFMNNEIDIVILDFTIDYLLASQFFEKIQNHESRLVILGIFDNKKCELDCSLLGKLDAILFNDFSIEQLKGKLFKELSLFYTIKSVSRRDNKIISGVHEIDMSLDEFFDMYEGSSLFIVDELIDLNKLLKSGELSTELINSIADKLFEIADTFGRNAKTADFSDVFRDFASYLKDLDFTKIEPKYLYALDYICAIIDDTNEYIMDMFVDRVLKDTYIVKHSLENNIEFIKNILSSYKNEDKSELEFF
ncbi:MAG: hypothetical protein RBR59_03040 [Sulfurimonadaceae bacterium]|jgi:hypothetical protein|nr:hypothetical protein [Sulfurimonadaceae bacterium]